ncbi:MAG: hypothetical protein AAF226_11070, partial [Verrucomicrobiota bacterium]
MRSLLLGVVLLLGVGRVIAEEGFGVIVRDGGIRAKVIEYRDGEEVITIKTYGQGMLTHFYRENSTYYLLPEVGDYAEYESTGFDIDPLYKVGFAEAYKDRIFLDNQRFKIEVLTKPFVKSEHTITMAGEKGYEYVSKIDGRHVYGQDGVLP